MTDIFQPAPEPPTELGRYRVLSKTAGIRVSPLCLGGMSLGDAWSEFLGSQSKENAFKLLDAFVEAGGNFIDTANNYQNEQSEQWIGEWMAARKNRDLMVIATKYTTLYRSYDLGKGKTVNYSGNHRKSLHTSVRDSLRKLQTDYIDILYLHWWDYTTSIEEVMDSLDILVKQGKVLYLGISDTPAWVVAAANTYATTHGKTPFSIYQGRWNVLLRDLERDIIPMARHFGMALAPWDVIGGGKFQSKKQIEQRKQQGEGLRKLLGPGEQTPDEEKISAALEKVAKEHGVESLSAVAIAYVMHKAPNVFPIVGGRKIEHLQDNIKALSIKLTDEQIAFLESVKPFDPGFPVNMIGENPRYTGKSQPALDGTAKIAWVKEQ
ncbi:putative aryl-alcohol dehydrogenase aad14 [Exophiala dermatitidis]|uniref:Aldo-keto reductase ausK n=2 Tax=Exophiala dermatitidis TaxID=5970 RepID=H6BL64_EXODN|nr:aryl-alcohol dehydrogenase AAD14 [Exophiala dermatitidis NIH/UT8656]KAJ4504493.1 putative aryl-alcohol dehydrogenase aad14 [Exophiala dermatitidis]EHY51811.1 aryl-alcohol dehydrogenase AAD14 [Exophiala dermatitidis NIH/UT8656]KAJ4505910.1 putative aryl-alcohol dehydrogenase aad14 [Exophiala dermatitidis]KAJ4506504.1 putative aryl-alcohol dehydrogenase aad14 [Exophiala dermatitidis]KAJ4533688.1 putative aryl-alcohol dehydrogenase aad14 [Exophiala dermatitidis]